MQLVGNASPISSNIDTFYTESKGDFWVNMKELPIIDETTFGIGQMPTEAVLPPAIIGGITFKKEGKNYIGLGSDNNGNLGKLYEYQPFLNKWIFHENAIPDDLLGRRYATIIESGQNIYVEGGCNPCTGYEQYHYSVRNKLDRLKSLFVQGSNELTIWNNQSKFILDDNDKKFGDLVTSDEGPIIAGYSSGEMVMGGVKKSEDYHKGDIENILSLIHI